MSQTRDTLKQIIDYLVGICSQTANFDNVMSHEPKSSPTGFDCSVWMQTMRPAASGLAVTSIRADFSIRIYENMLKNPQDDIDGFLAAATWDVMAAINADVSLGGLVREVDLLGEAGDPLASEAGYITIERSMQRVVTITVPCLINDAWDQVRTA